MDEFIVVGARTDSAQGLVAGSRQFPCSDCGAMIWLAPSGQKLQSSGAVVSCEVCIMVKVSLTSEQISEETLDELQAMWGFRPSRLDLLLFLTQKWGNVKPRTN